MYYTYCWCIEVWTRPVTYTLANQTISVTSNAPASSTYGSTFPVAATASSGLTVAITTTGGCSVASGIVTMTSATTSCVVHYNQAGDSSYNAAPEVTQTTTTQQKNLTITGLTADNKVYDRTTSATLSGTPSLSGIVGADVVTLGGSPTATFANKIVANGKAVTVVGYTLGGAQSGNYTLTQPTGLTANITTKGLTITGITANNKIYNGTTTATLTGTASLVGIVAGDTVTVGSPSSVTFSDKNVGTGKAVTATGYSLSGGDAGNYSLSQPTGLTANITTRSLFVAATGVNKVYDATTTGTVTLSENPIDGDDVVPAYTGATFNNKNVGTGKTVSVTGISISGTDAPNYVVNTTVTTSANITPATLIISANGIDKVYDASTDATVSLDSNEFEGDVITSTYTSASFDTKNVGTGKTVSVTGIAISGTDAGNYTANTTTTTTAAITPKSLVVTAGGINKVYDGGTNATVTLSTNEIEGDDVSADYTSAAFATPDVGTEISVNVSGISLLGGDGGNYTPNTTASTTADITTASAVVTLDNEQNLNPTYDGTPKPLTFSTDPSGLSLTITYNGETTVPTEGGTYTVVAQVTDPSSPNYSGSIEVVMTIGKASQTITFAELFGEGHTTTADTADFTPSASSTSELPVSFTVNNEEESPVICTVTENVVHLTGVLGTCTLVAGQSGNSNYNAAEDVSRSFEVTVGELTHITIAPTDSTITADDTATFTATGRDQFENSTGDVTEGTTFSINEAAGGGFGLSETASNVYTAEFVSASETPWVVTATYGEGESTHTATANLTVTPGIIASITITPTESTIEAGDSVTYIANGFDSHGNSTGVETNETVFSATPEGGSFGVEDDHALYTSHDAGDFTILGTYTGDSEEEDPIVLTATAALTVNPVPAPTASPVAGTYGSTQSVTLSSAGESDAIHYTLDGSTPTCESALYEGALSVAVSKTIKAVSCRGEGNITSQVSSFVYTITIPATVVSGGGGGGGFFNLNEIPRTQPLPNTGGPTIPAPTSGTTIPAPQVLGEEITNVSEVEKTLATKTDTALVKRLLGRILIQVETLGRAWYVNPFDSLRYYLGRPTDAFAIMRRLGVGMSTTDIRKLPMSLDNSIGGTDTDKDGLSDVYEKAVGTNPTLTDTDNDGQSDKAELQKGTDPLNKANAPYMDKAFAAKHAGKIVLKVQGNGEAFYINPLDNKAYYLSRPSDAFALLRKLGLGITNNDIHKIPVGILK